ncbi:MAG: hypothetical protein EPO12_20065 [Aquabacterium sp.]|jgi:hypothetical protein|nr:MAG: hypothetical protein EPO12_20065 [Aquabacterium sp.]
MRGVFSFIGLLIVIAVLAVVARNQMPGMQAVSVQASPAASSASATFEQRAGGAQAQQMVDEVNRAAQQRQAQIEGQLGLPAVAGAASAAESP